jgi:HlyD family secretion protein
VSARVSLVSPALDPGSTTIEIWVQSRRPSTLLKPGMTTSVDMTAKTVKDAIVVPTSAVFKDAEDAYYVLLAGADQKAHRKAVHLGIRTPPQSQVTSGVNVGDAVITSAGYAVPDGTAIQIEKSDKADGKGEAGSDKKAGDEVPMKPGASTTGKEQ